MLSLFPAALALVVGMSCAWAVQRATGNAGWVDAIWSFASGATGAMVALLGGEVGWRAALLAMLVGGWGLRLGLHIAARAGSGHEDRRYAALRAEWGGDFQRRMFWFLMMQAACAWLLMPAILAGARVTDPDFRLQDALGVLTLLVALAGEALSDFQLRRFRANPAQRGQVCATGLWAWSRHPNYFCEWLIWLAWPAFAFGGDWRWWIASWSGAVLMYWLLVHVSGIPPLEAQMARTRGAAWDAYAARTNAFFPRKPRISPRI